MHARDTYRILKTSTNKMVQTRNVRWATWKPSQPGDDVHMEIEPLQENDVDLMEDHMNYTKYYGEESDENTSEASTDYNNDTDDVDLFLEDSDDEAGRKDLDLIGPEVSSDEEELSLIHI